MKRVQAYIDGFNLYFGMVSAGLDHCKWNDVVAMSTSFLKPGENLVGVKYFTSRVSNNPPKEQRQDIYLRALKEKGAELIYGQYKNKLVTCNRCAHVWNEPKEKMTDVNIATHLLVDAMHDVFDVALLVTGDSDLVPPIHAVRKLFPQKTVIVLFPPMRHNITVAQAASASMIIGRKKLVDSQLENPVVKQDGYKLWKPTTW